MVELPPQQPSQEFKEERSHRDAEASNATGRAAAQAVILINGGAATAVLAYLAKGGLDPTVIRTVGLTLIGYVVGVASGGYMLYFKMHALDQYSHRWLLEASSKNAKAVQAKAYQYGKVTLWCFGLSMLAFVVSSIVVAWTLADAKPPAASAVASPGAVLLKVGAPYLANLVHANHPRQPFPADQGQMEGR